MQMYVSPYVYIVGDTQYLFGRSRLPGCPPVPRLRPPSGPPSPSTTRTSPGPGVMKLSELRKLLKLSCT